MSLREYSCITCHRSDAEPLNDVRICPHSGCGDPVCVHCRPDHEALHARPTISASAELDRNGFTIERRYELILGYYLEETHLSRAGHWDCKKIREWAEVTWLPLNVIHRGIMRAVDRAQSGGHAIWAFGYLEPHLIAAARQYLEASAGLGPQVERRPIPREKQEAPR